MEMISWTLRPFFERGLEGVDAVDGFAEVFGGSGGCAARDATSSGGVSGFFWVAVWMTISNGCWHALQRIILPMEARMRSLTPYFFPQCGH